MKITRKETFMAFKMNWCPKCAKVTDMKSIHTGMPGIQASKCPCGMQYQINLLEDEDDMLEVPDTFVMPNIDSENIVRCPFCRKTNISLLPSGQHVCNNCGGMLGGLDSITAML